MNCFEEKCKICRYQDERFMYCGSRHCGTCISCSNYEPMSVESLYPKCMIDPRKLAEMTYIDTDIVTSRDIIKSLINSRFGARKVPTIKNVIFNDPATIVFWQDGTKTVVKAQNGEEFDPEKGLAMAISKKALGNEGNYFNDIKKWVDKYHANYEDVTSKLKKLAEVVSKIKAPKFNFPKFEPALKITFDAKTHRPVEENKPLTYSDIYEDFLKHYPSMQDRAQNHWTAALARPQSIYVCVGRNIYCYDYNTKLLNLVAK